MEGFNLGENLCETQREREREREKNKGKKVGQGLQMRVIGIRLVSKPTQFKTPFVSSTNHKDS